MTIEDLNEVVAVNVKLKRGDRNDFKEACKALDLDMNKWVVQQAKKLILNHKRNKGCK